MRPSRLGIVSCFFWGVDDAWAYHYWIPGGLCCKRPAAKYSEPSLVIPKKQILGGDGCGKKNKFDVWCPAFSPLVLRVCTTSQHPLHHPLI